MTFSPSAELPLSLYIHIPWCIRKCPYCDFNSHENRGDLPEMAYIAALIRDLDSDLIKVPNRRLHSIFIGGGTPSLFSPIGITNILAAVKQRIPFEQGIEITLEANPGTIDFERFAEFRAAGVNRLSIGIQSFQADKLLSLGRIHDGKTAVKAVEAAHKAGFDNFNLDLMYGLPQQTESDALYDLETALALKPTHISWYQLTIEPNTLFHHTPPTLPDEDLIWEMQEAGKTLLSKQQFNQYEVSAYCLPGKSSQHNLNYWQFGDYLGIGAGAHGKITDPNTQQISRYWKTKHPKEYLNAEKSYIASEQIINAEQVPFEFMLNALRLYQPIPFSLFNIRTGLSLQQIETSLLQAKQKDLITYDENHLNVTDLGRRFLNDLIGIFMI